MDLHTLLRALYAAILLAVSYTDIRWRRIPNRIIYPGILIALFAAFLEPNWANALLAGIAAASIFIIPILLFGTHQAGVGDVKMALFVGLILAFPDVLYAIAISAITALLVHIPGLGLGRVSRKTSIPFGPFLAFGTLVMLISRWV